MSMTTIKVMPGVIMKTYSRFVQCVTKREPMGKETNISWCDATWNVARGCHKVDADCKFCYMYRDSFDGTRYNPRQVIRTKTVFNLPLKLKEPSKIFTSSLTDFFLEEIDAYRDECWDIIRRCPQHTFQILTKRPERINRCLPEDWLNLNNVWIGTSVGSGGSIERIPILLTVPGNQIKFVSIEPMWDFVDIWPHIAELYWVIVGGESGNETGQYRYRQCSLKWIEDIMEACHYHEKPLFIKQLGTHLAKELKLKDRHGRDQSEWPLHLRNNRKFP